MNQIQSTIPNNRRLFSVYIFYRLAMSVLLYVLFISGLADNIFGTNKPELFLYSSFIYVVLCGISLALYLLDLLRPKAKHLLFLLIADFISLVLIIYSSNSASVGLGYLLLIPMAIGGTFLKGQANVGLAAFASLLLIIAGAMNTMDGSSTSSSIFTAGITGVLLFVTAMAFSLLSHRIKVSESQVKEQTETVNYLQGISQRIIETIHSGILVVDDQLNILLINKAAKDLLSHKTTFTSIQHIRPIDTILKEWKTTKKTPATTTVNLGVNHDIKINFTDLSDKNRISIMLFLEDERHINQEAQQLKLASLGRLTASIAHEIRNPLGAISHASQLLDESESIHKNDQELLQMIQINSNRIDQTINNILQFSRRKGASPENINICQWLEKFVYHYQKQYSPNVNLLLGKDNIYCKMDPNHLQQIITNLVDNGLRHGKSAEGKGFIDIIANIDPQSKLPYIDIADTGKGIDEDHIDKIFEPFYTTKQTGSGLGLYLCKELCQANQADIVYFNKTEHQKSCFRLILN